jgi:hypothetical protein
MGTVNQHAPQKQAKAQNEQESKASSLAAVHNTSIDSPGNSSWYMHQRKFRM